MIYLLIELRSKFPVLSQVDNIDPETLDHDFEWLIRVHENVFEKYDPKTKLWTFINMLK